MSHFRRDPKFARLKLFDVPDSKYLEFVEKTNHLLTIDDVECALGRYQMTKEFVKVFGDQFSHEVTQILKDPDSGVVKGSVNPQVIDDELSFMRLLIGFGGSFLRPYMDVKNNGVVQTAITNEKTKNLGTPNVAANRRESIYLHVDGIIDSIEKRANVHVVVLGVPNNSSADGGESVLLNVRDIDGIDMLASSKMATHDLNYVYRDFYRHWEGELIEEESAVYHSCGPTFGRWNNHLTLYYSPGAVRPENQNEIDWLTQLDSAISHSTNIMEFQLCKGEFLAINNLFYLHGRKQFLARRDHHRVLQRILGQFP